MNIKHIYLLVGPRAAGKSHYAKRLRKLYPHLQIVSRDEILIRRFDKTDTSPYSGAHWYAKEVMYRLLRRKLHQECSVEIVLDCWTGDNQERSLLVSKLRRLGATHVTALYFATSRRDVTTWFWRKPGIARISEYTGRNTDNLTYFSEEAPGRDYDTFHRLAEGIEDAGFDDIKLAYPHATSTRWWRANQLPLNLTW